MENVARTFGQLLYLKTAQSKQSPNRLKFGQSGHPDIAVELGQPLSKRSGEGLHNLFTRKPENRPPMRTYILHNPGKNELCFKKVIMILWPQSQKK
jgi:hypothetical protein